jgi:hypothetical protein
MVIGEWCRGVNKPVQKNGHDVFGRPLVEGWALFRRHPDKSE